MTAPKRAKISAQNRVKKKPRGRPFATGNPYRIRPGESKNPGGRPKLLGESYTRMLARVNEADPQGRTNAELIAEAVKVEGLKGNVAAIRELRRATEGDLQNVRGELRILHDLDGMIEKVYGDDSDGSADSGGPPDSGGLPAKIEVGA